MDYHVFFHNFSMIRREYFSELLEKTELNLMEVEILVYLGRNPEKNTFTEVQKWNDYSKSHISTSINRLIDKEYLVREVSPNNKKVHYLTLKDNAKTILEEYTQCVDTFHQYAFSGVSLEEKEMLDSLINKISRNLQINKESKEG